MVQKAWFIGAFAAFPYWAYSSSDAPDDLPVFFLNGHSQSGSLVLKAIAPIAHHFNLKAPMVLESAKIPHRVTPSEKSLREVIFRVPEAVAADLKVSVYLCDDKNTICEKRSVNAIWTSSRKLVVQTD